MSQDSFEIWMTERMIQYADRNTVTLALLKREARHNICKLGVWQQDQMVYNAMYALEQSKWVIRIDDRSQENQHIAEWAINPALINMFSTHRSKIVAAKQRLKDYIYRESGKLPSPVHGFVRKESP